VNLILQENIIYVCIKNEILYEILIYENRGYKIITSKIFLEAGSFSLIFFASSYNSLKIFIFISPFVYYMREILNCSKFLFGYFRSWKLEVGK
jgi:hypothetical protein